MEKTEKDIDKEMIQEKSLVEKKPERNLSFDALRIWAMIMVTILHITGHGLAEAEIVMLSGTYWIVLVLNSFSLVAVNCFVLITGYFLSSGITKFKKLVLLWLQVWMYSVSIYLTLCLVPTVNVEFNYRELVRCGLPILSNQYWFFQCYFLLYLISPILNILIKTLKKNTYQKALALLIVLFGVIPSVNIFGDTFGANGGYSLTWFIVLYLVSGYIKKYPIFLKVNSIYIYISSCIALCIIRLLGDFMGSIVQTVGDMQTNYNGPLVFLASVSLLMHCKISCKKYNTIIETIIKKISPLTFGVYLLHDHRILSQILWKEWIRLPDNINQPVKFLVHIIIILVFLFLCGIVLEWIRSGIVKNISRLVKKISRR